MKNRLIGLTLIISFVFSSLIFFAGCDASSILGDNFSGAQASTYVSINVGPSVELIVDSNDKVITVNGVNNQGDIAAEGTKYRGYNIAEAVKCIVQNMTEAGFLDLETSEGNAAFITVINEDVQNQTRLYYEIKTATESYFFSNGIYGLVAETELPEEIKDVADANDLGNETVRLMLKLMEMDMDLNFEDVEELEIDELIRLVNVDMELLSEMYTEQQKTAYKLALKTARENYDNSVTDYIKTEENLRSNTHYSSSGKNYTQLLAEIDALEELYWSTSSSSELATLQAQLDLKEEELDELEDRLFSRYSSIISSMKSSYDIQISALDIAYVEDRDLDKEWLEIELVILKDINSERYTARQALTVNDGFRGSYNNWKNLQESDLDEFYDEISASVNSIIALIKADVAYALSRIDAYTRTISFGFGDSIIITG